LKLLLQAEAAPSLNHIRDTRPLNPDRKVFFMPQFYRISSQFPRVWPSAHNSALTRSRPCSAKAAWARSTVHATPPSY